MTPVFGSEKKPIRSVLQQAVTAVAFVLLLVAMLAAAYISVSNSKNDRLRSEETTHTTLAELIKPALAISDFLEVQRLLGLVTKPDSIFGVLTQEGDLLLSDYEKRSLYEDIIRSKASTQCSSLNGDRLWIQGRGWSFHCTELAVSNQPIHDLNFGPSKLISLRAVPSLALSLSDFVKALSLLLVTVVLSTAYMRRVVSKKILRPLEDLSFLVVTRMENSELGASQLLPPLTNSPLEIGELHRSFNRLLESLTQYYKERKEVEKGLALAQLASQVSHDIRSPLASLQTIIQTTKGLNEETRVQVRTATARIRDIANNLLASNRGVPKDRLAVSELGLNENLISNDQHIELLYPLVDSVISQKRLQYYDQLGINIHWNAYSQDYILSANIQLTEFTCLISNLISNAVEALDGKGDVTISLMKQDDHACITIRDNGKGMTRETLNSIGNRGATFGKEDGNGLGVWHAKKTIESWCGIFEIKSELGQGTVVSISLPHAESPSWLANRISISKNNIVTVVDDDPSIHHIWRNRIELKSESGQSPELHHLHSPTELINWYRENLPPEALYLCDYEFNNMADNGLDLIERIGIAKQAILVTSHWDDTSVRQRCERLGVRILPKTFAAYVQVDIIS